MELDEKKLKKIFEKYPQVRIVYFFGSRAEGREGPMSDYDFAVYLEEKDKMKMYDVKFFLMDELSRFFGTDKVDVVVLNLTESTELKFEVIKNGKIIYEVEPCRVIIEPKIMNEYFDFHQMLVRNNLTKDK